MDLWIGIIHQNLIKWILFEQVISNKERNLVFKFLMNMKGKSMKIIHFTSLFLLLIYLAGCMSNVDLDNERTLLFKTDQEFAEKSKEVGPAEAFYLYMDNDGIQIPVSGDVVIGDEAIRERMLNAGDYQLLWSPKKAEVAIAGDMGWTWGTYTFQANDDEGNTIKRNGKYLNIWRKQEDGSWKVSVDIGNIEPEQ
jgi:ketosteroid isomerase-like protein